MSELKTLKDLNFVNSISFKDPPIESELRIKKTLKQEAIKRIKVWEIQKIKFKEIGNEAGINCVQQIQNEFIDFFNITKEDLK